MWKILFCALLFTRSSHGALQGVSHSRFFEGWRQFMTRNAEDEPIEESDSDVSSSVAFYLYTRSTKDTPVKLNPEGVFAIEQSDIDFSKRTIVLVHGFRNNLESNMIQHIKDAALQNEDVNVIATDWGRYTKNPNYLYVLEKVNPVGVYLGEFLKYLLNEGLQTSTLHLIGHSLGAHVSGFAGKELQVEGYKAARITGLDAALPGFTDRSDKKTRLCDTDADFVDCIHTTAGLLGYDVPICQSDFYPNGGIFPQPGCTFLDFGSCSHGRSFEYFAESFNASHAFPVQHCKSIVLGVPYGCKSEGALMGYFATPENKGEFYLRTNRSPPYSKDVQEE